jgi:hypothetical protein
MIAHYMTKGGSVVSARDFIDVRYAHIRRRNLQYFEA